MVAVCEEAQVPAAPSDGSLTVYGSAPYAVGVLISYTCNLATHEINPDTVNCLLSGSWSPSVIGNCEQTSKNSVFVVCLHNVVINFSYY